MMGERSTSNAKGKAESLTTIFSQNCRVENAARLLLRSPASQMAGFSRIDSLHMMSRNGRRSYTHAGSCGLLYHTPDWCVAGGLSGVLG